MDYALPFPVSIFLFLRHRLFLWLRDDGGSSSIETSVSLYQTAWPHIPDNSSVLRPITLIFSQLKLFLCSPVTYGMWPCCRLQWQLPASKVGAQTVISDCRRGANCIFSSRMLRLPTFRNNLWISSSSVKIFHWRRDPIGCTETSINNYQSPLPRYIMYSLLIQYVYFSDFLHTLS